MRRRRNPVATKQAIIEGCLTCLATGGDEGVSFQRVAQVTGVNRSSIYDYYQTRENLIRETVAWMSDKLHDAVFGDGQALQEGPFADYEILELNERLVNFAMDNPELCRAWLIQVLSMPDPQSDRFWKKYAGEMDRFAGTRHAREGVDAEALTVNILAGAFLWPVMARARTRSKANLRREARRYLRETFRNTLYGSVRPEYFPEVVRKLAEWEQEATPRPRTAATG
jgi:AcrR family transcriptional regulator